VTDPEAAEAVRAVTRARGPGFLVPEALRTEILRTALETAMIGPIDPDAPKPPPPTWRQKLRWKRGDWRERTARRAYRIIAGYWPGNGEDDW